MNNIIQNLNKDYSYEAINGNMTNNLVTNTKSANKNENSNRKKRIIFHQKNFLRTRAEYFSNF